MKYTVEILNEHLDFLVQHKITLKQTVFRHNRYDDTGTRIIGSLIKQGILEHMPYYGEQLCYHPEYRLTGLGKDIFGAYVESKRLKNELAACERQ